MSQKLLRSLEELAVSIENNATEVEEKIAASGGIPDTAVIISASKYHSALERLAQE